MTDILDQASPYTTKAFSRKLHRRRLLEQTLKGLGIFAILSAIGMMLLLFSSVAMTGASAFQQTRIGLPIYLDPEEFRGSDRDLRGAIDSANYGKLIRVALTEVLGEPGSRSARRKMIALVSSAAGYQLSEVISENPGLIGKKSTVWLPASDDVDILMKGLVPREVPESGRRLNDRQLAWIDALNAEGLLETRFNWDLLLRSDSREPEVAGVFGAVVSSALMLIVTLLAVVPIGLAAAIYLEEFAPRNRWTELIDVNIRNLAAVPSIVFGLLGLAVFIRLFGIPRSTPVAGGLVLALLSLPTIIIAARAAIEAVPPSLREAALQLGASRMQASFLVVLPNALPGILTGTIIGMAEALGETAPLLMIGMVAFIATSPSGFLDPAAPLPVQIYLWSTSPERAFEEKTAAAIIILLVFLLLMNALAIYLRIRSQRRW